MKKYKNTGLFDLNRLINKSAARAPDSIQISFKGYAAEDVECEYCLYYSVKSKGCRVVKCCCEDEKQQAAHTAAK